MAGAPKPIEVGLGPALVRGARDPAFLFFAGCKGIWAIFASHRGVEMVGPIGFASTAAGAASTRRSPAAELCVYLGAVTSMWGWGPLGASVLFAIFGWKRPAAEAPEIAEPPMRERW